MLLKELAFPRARPAGAHDEGFLKDLYASTRDDLAPLAADPVTYALLIDMQWRAQRGGYRAAHPDAHDLIVEDDEGRAGRVLVDALPAAWRLVDLALLPRARKRGYGGAILRALQGAALDAGVPLALRVRHDNPGARRLYAALGFEPVERDDIALQMRWPGP